MQSMQRLPRARDTGPTLALRLVGAAGLLVMAGVPARVIALASEATALAALLGLVALRLAGRRRGAGRAGYRSLGRSAA